MESWIPYLLTVTPGLVLIGIIAALLPRQAHGVRILVLVLGFVFARDAMTTHGLWEMGVVGREAGGGPDAVPGTAVPPVPWLRFTDDPVALLVLAVASLALAAGIVLACRDLRWTVLWSGPRWWLSVLAGLAGAAVIVAPFLWLYGTLGTWFPALAGGAGVVPLDERGGAVAGGVLVALAVFALCGNLVEEVLFRGFLQAHLEDATPGRTGRWRAALLSGLVFAAAHLALAYLLTDLGWPVVAFTLLEGLVCAVVAMRQGVLGATVAHGGAIFVLASGLV
ncbi:CPBP family intramembrane metalloprotease [Citricoccus sp. SGAir0253]|uniref:CPBP family glutamic-type intramembrane protease n=1 Tax=Citricoccus sp. SGAir0253 TaxID=2567881 RepID=UPI0010CD1FD3|nr:CPBP family glutamic-type intramembrane protease [Citricoccus sp. SGAir0253]QCU77496.1 CPBP family intramembrane metalloprotease [Citricoccus sp. SGAir0253]